MDMKIDDDLLETDSDLEGDMEVIEKIPPAIWTPGALSSAAWSSGACAICWRIRSLMTISIERRHSTDRRLLGRQAIGFRTDLDLKLLHRIGRCISLAEAGDVVQGLALVYQGQIHLADDHPGAG